MELKLSVRRIRVGRCAMEPPPSVAKILAGALAMELKVSARPTPDGRLATEPKRSAKEIRAGVPAKERLPTAGYILALQVAGRRAILFSS